jgi:hypothetical protein
MLKNAYVKSYIGKSFLTLDVLCDFKPGTPWSPHQAPEPCSLEILDIYIVSKTAREELTSEQVDIILESAQEEIEEICLEAITEELSDSGWIHDTYFNVWIQPRKTNSLC